jgi:hypothetical protein
MLQRRLSALLADGQRRGLVPVVAAIGVLGVAAFVLLVIRPFGPRPIDGTFKAGEHDLYLRCAGASGPTAPFESAIGGDRTLWAIAQKVGEQAYVCTYDRAGNGDSSATDRPMSAGDYADELHALLAPAAVPGTGRPGGAFVWRTGGRHGDGAPT